MLNSNTHYTIQQKINFLIWQIIRASIRARINASIYGSLKENIQDSAKKGDTND